MIDGNDEKITFEVVSGAIRENFGRKQEFDVHIYIFSK